MAECTMSIKPAELGTAVVTMEFADSLGNTVVPTSLYWQLQRTNGVVINNRIFTDNQFTGSFVVLTGDDLALFGASDNTERIFSIHATYDSTYGSDLSLNAEFKFSIEKLLSQTDQ